MVAYIRLYDGHREHQVATAFWVPDVWGIISRSPWYPEQANLVLVGSPADPFAVVGWRVTW